MNNARVATALVARLNGDATLVSALTGGLWFGMQRATTFNPPYAVFNLQDAEDDTFTDDGSLVEIEFRIVSTAIGTAASSLSVPSAIIDRIKGDAMLQAGRTPSYGLHRHLLVLDSGGENYVGGFVQRVGGETAHDIDNYVFIERYRVYQSAPATSP